MVRRSLACCMSLVILGGLVAACDGSAPGTEVAVVLDWSMPDRFGLDADDDGLPDIPNTYEYVHGLEPGACAGGCDPSIPAFPVRLTAAVDPPVAGLRYSWEVSGEGLEIPWTAATAESAVEATVPEGVYRVTVHVSGEGVAAATTVADVTVADRLVVALGDSYASGEGNPERPAGDGIAVWADDGSGGESEEWVAHQRAHRSALAAAAQTALELERSDPRSSVTFVFLAASGASVEEGLLGALSGADRELWPDAADLPPQISEAGRLLGCGNGTCSRTADAVILSIGGNDVGWARLQGELVALEKLGGAGIYEALVDRAFDRAERDIAALGSLLERTGAELAATLAPEAVYLVAYPSPARGYDASGDERYPVCDAVLGGILPFLEVDDVELGIAEERFIAPLNEALREAAAALGWRFVDAHLEAFRGHGYCGTAPYAPAQYPGDPYPAPVTAPDDPAVRWFRQADESVTIQGAPGAGRFTPEELATRGANHPNEFGHRAIADALLAALAG